MAKEPYDYQAEYGEAIRAPQPPFDTAAPRVDPVSPYIPPQGGRVNAAGRVTVEANGRTVSIDTQPPQEWSAGQSAGSTAYSRPKSRQQDTASPRVLPPLRGGSSPASPSQRDTATPPQRDAAIPSQRDAATPRALPPLRGGSSPAIPSQKDELGRAMNELADVFARDVAPALQQAGRDVGAAMKQAGKEVGPAMHQAGRNLRRAAEEARAAQAARAAQSARQQAMRLGRAEKQRMTVKRVFSLIGGTFCAFFFAFFLAAFFGMLDGGVDIGAAFSVLPFAVATEFGAIRLFRNAGRWKRARRYREFLDGWAGCTLKELSGNTGRSEEYLRKDLQTMIGGRYLRGAFLDVRDNVLFADEASYREYLDERRVREMEEQARRAEYAARAAEEQRRREAQESQPAAVEEESFSAEAGHFLDQLAALRAEISDPLVLEQVDQLEKIVRGISGWVADHPASAPKVKRLSSYYLPTTLKLLRTYTTVDDNPGPTAQNICRNITGILHTFNTALLTMQDSLLEDTALDVSAEISVLESMLQQEGLTGTADFAPLAVRGESAPAPGGELPELRLDGMPEP